VNNDAYFTQLIHYIHYNPVHHGFVESLDDWTYSSYHSLLSEKKTNINREDVIKWFGDKQEFKKLHSQKPESRLFLEMDY
jgi:hypothetical protein